MLREEGSIGTKLEHIFGRSAPFRRHSTNRDLIIALATCTSNYMVRDIQKALYPPEPV